MENKMGLYEILSLVLIKKNISVPLSLDYSIIETDIMCPKCNIKNLICIHLHNEGVGPSTHNPYDYDNFIHVCSSEYCDYIDKKLEDTPKNRPDFKRPKKCIICGRSLEDPNRQYNNSQF